jgi:hypothetical protein
MTTHQVFISYSTQDKNTADAICSWLERHNVRCWIAPRDITPGAQYGESILNAISNCSVMVVVFTEHANRSRFVGKEVERAVSKGNIVVPFRLQDVLPTHSLEFFLSSDHWLDATSPPLERHLERLVNTIRILLSSNDVGEESRADLAEDRKAMVLFDELAPHEWGRRPGGNKFKELFNRLFDDKS